jgi:acetyl-CoA acetyltransferase
LKETAIVGVGFTPLARKTDRSVASLAVEAAMNAIADAGLKPSDIDGYAGTPIGGSGGAVHLDGVDEISCRYITDALDLQNMRWLTDAARGLLSDAIVDAVHALAYGTCSYALIVRAMYNPTDTRYSETEMANAGGPAQFIGPYGLHYGIGRMAMWLNRYMHDTGATKAELYHVAKALRENAQLNPYAFWRGKPLSEADYLNARMIFEPMGLYDCDIPVTGAGAIVLTTADRAAHLRHKPAYVKALATSLEGPDAVYGKAGIAPDDVQCAQLYDGFLPFIWYWLEALRFCGKGEGHAFALDGNIALGGKLPVTTFGGSQGEGRLHGMGHIREGALQVMGRAGERQVPNTQHCLVSIGVDWIPGAVFLLSGT